MGLVAGPLAGKRQLLAPGAGQVEQGLWWCLCCCWALSVPTLQFTLKDNWKKAHSSP